MTRNTRMSFLAAAALALGVAACEPYPPPGRVVAVERVPPAARVEVWSEPPGPEYVWISGYWYWGSTDFVWMPGYWRRPPAGYRAWVPGQWKRHGRGWAYHDGHWKH